MVAPSILSLLSLLLVPSIAAAPVPGFSSALEARRASSGESKRQWFPSEHYNARQEEKYDHALSRWSHWDTKATAHHQYPDPLAPTSSSSDSNSHMIPPISAKHSPHENFAMHDSLGNLADARARQWKAKADRYDAKAHGLDMGSPQGRRLEEGVKSAREAKMAAKGNWIETANRHGVDVKAPQKLNLGESVG